ncbi:hypothetical protein F4604DRAFT_1679883 [Suillus subluteus]|nr:hypothetical protein F4604DRAFT_1679883 [Suillus subluteus]
MQVILFKQSNGMNLYTQQKDLIWNVLSSGQCETALDDKVDNLSQEAQITSCSPIDEEFTDLCLWEFVERTIKIRVENECKDARDMHAAAVREERAAPHVFGSRATEQGDVQEDMMAFDDALMANSALDGNEDDCNAVDTSQSQQEIYPTENAGDIETCLRAAKDGGLLDTSHHVVTGNIDHESWGTEITGQINEVHLKEYASIMKAAHKRKRPVDVGSSDAEVKRAQLNVNNKQLEENVDITSAFYKPELTTEWSRGNLSEIIEEFKLSDNPEQEMSLRIISDHFIRGEVKQLLMFITGIRGSVPRLKCFRRCGAPEKLTLSALTGSAAVLIDGYTIHALTFLPNRQTPIKQQDLEFIWRTVKYLILDEAFVDVCRIAKSSFPSNMSGEVME